MTQPHDLDQMRAHCETTRQAYRSQSSQRAALTERRETLTAEVQHLHAQIADATDPDTTAKLKADIASADSQLSDIDRELAIVEQSLIDIENDYKINQCPAVLGPIG